jgi:hypothetical protein
MPATGQETQFPPLERRGLRVLPTVADRLVRPNSEKSMPVSRTSEPVRHAGRFTLYNMCLQVSEDWLYCAYFPEAKSRDFSDLWPPDAIVSEMTATGFTRRRGRAAACPPRARFGGAVVGSRFRERNS